MTENDFNKALQKHLQKCELNYRIKNGQGPSEIPWLAPYCDTIPDIVSFLRSLRYKIKEIMDKEDCDGEPVRWVETTNGLIVYVNDEYSHGLIGIATKW